MAEKKTVRVEKALLDRIETYAVSKSQKEKRLVPMTEAVEEIILAGLAHAEKVKN